MGFFWMSAGIFSVVYGLRGERVPGRVISISDTDSNSLGLAKRVVWILFGAGAIVLGFVDLYARFKRA